MTRPPRLTPIHSMRASDGTPCIGCDALSHELAHLHLENVRMSTALADARAEAERLRARLSVHEGDQPPPGSPLATADDVDEATLASWRRRLGEARDRADLLAGIEELLLIGVACERWAIFRAGGLSPVASAGLRPNELAPIPLGADVLMRVARSGEPILPDAFIDLTGLASAGIPVACVPIRAVDERGAGVIALYGMLPRKTAIRATDRALLELLAVEAVRAL